MFNLALLFITFLLLAACHPSTPVPSKNTIQDLIDDTPDFIVSKDGSGHFTTISAAVDAAPSDGARRFVIYIKEGTYFENVVVQKRMIKFVGDGIGKTVVKAGLNQENGSSILTSPTVAVIADGFVAKGMTFENSAGPTKYQAVALRVQSDSSAFYKCSMKGYQDTLFTQKGRQFYRECDVYGTVDVIFGDATVVMQSCNLYARKPMQGQANVLTAQGRTRARDSTGLAIFNSKIAATYDLAHSKYPVKTYLGRPWKEYSRTVFIRCHMENVVDPAGWLPWNGTFALSTLYYGEFRNTGAGSNTAHRVQWPGYRILNQAEASRFRAKSFIQGDTWLPETGVPH